MLSFIAGALALAIVPLYTRIGAREALEHATRAALHDLLAARPGLDRTEISGALDLNVATIVHHLEIMTAVGLVRARRVGRVVLYDLGGAPPEHPALRAPQRREIARLIEERPRTQNELVKETGLSQRLVAYHLQQMAPLVRQDDGRPRRYALERRGRSPETSRS